VLLSVEAQIVKVFVWAILRFGSARAPSDKHVHEIPDDYRRVSHPLSSLVFGSAHYFRPIANRLADERTYITPSDKAGVAISSSPIEFVAT
jgi:hypothetical protein